MPAYAGIVATAVGVLASFPARPAGPKVAGATILSPLAVRGAPTRRAPKHPESVNGGVHERASR